MAEDSSGLVLIQSPIMFLFQVAMGGATANIFHHQHDLRLRLNHIVELGYVWMVYPPHDLYLASD